MDLTVSIPWPGLPAGHESSRVHDLYNPHTYSVASSPSFPLLYLKSYNKYLSTSKREQDRFQSFPLYSTFGAKSFAFVSCNTASFKLHVKWMNSGAHYVNFTKQVYNAKPCFRSLSGLVIHLHRSKYWPLKPRSNSIGAERILQS